MGELRQLFLSGETELETSAAPRDRFAMTCSDLVTRYRARMPVLCCNESTLRINIGQAHVQLEVVTLLYWLINLAVIAVSALIRLVTNDTH